MGRKESDMIFHEGFTSSIYLQGDKLIVASVRPENKAQIDEGLHYLSSESIRNRFMGSKKKFTPEELSYLTELDGWNHSALGVMESSGARRGVGIIRMVRSSQNPAEAEVAITIIDEYQKRGLGTILLSFMILAAKEREIHQLSFTYFPQNQGIEKLLRKVGSIQVGALTPDTKQVLMKIDALSETTLNENLRPYLKHHHNS